MQTSHHHRREKFLRPKDFAAPADVKALFISHAMPSDFLEDLQDDIAEFQSAITEQSGKIGDRKSSGVNIDVTADRGMTIRRKMDAIVRRQPRRPGRMGNRQPYRARAEKEKRLWRIGRLNATWVGRVSGCIRIVFDAKTCDAEMEPPHPQRHRSPIRPRQQRIRNGRRDTNERSEAVQ